MNDRLFSLLLLCGLCLGACAQLEQRAASTNGAWSSHGADSAEVLAYFQHIRGLSADVLTAEHAAASQALAKRRSDVNRLKLALLLIQPRTALKDETRAVALANEVANNKTAASEMKNLALLLAAIANEQKQQEERLQQLAQKQKDDEKRADSLQQKLDALKSIEQDLIRREQTKRLKTR